SQKPSESDQKASLFFDLLRNSFSGVIGVKHEEVFVFCDFAGAGPERVRCTRAGHAALDDP
ncbi:MAG: hypothetical protein ACK2UN_15975, partial [Candidatus Promineifilaceae bacterium]